MNKKISLLILVLLLITFLISINIRRIKNTYYYFLGFSSCPVCGDSFAYKKGCDIRYAPHRGMFPICQECFNKLSEREIERYVEKLVQSWAKYDPAHLYNEMSYKQIYENAIEDVRKQKKNEKHNWGQNGI